MQALGSYWKGQMLSLASEPVLVQPWSWKASWFQWNWPTFHTEMEQARMAACVACEVDYKDVVAPILPTGIYTIPEASMAGETEESLKAKGISYVVGRARYADNPCGQIIGDESGLLKLIFRQDDMRLLGVRVGWRTGDRSCSSRSDRDDGRGWRRPVQPHLFQLSNAGRSL
jgi:Pyridine nucleotide-disulphide oxidoreductase, dimerisation domain